MSEEKGIELKPIECTNCGYTETFSPLDVDKLGLVRCPICGKSNLVEYDFVDYNAGYRKQSEWISVDERLPERCGYYLGCTYKGGMLIAPFFSVFANDKPEFHYKIAYWMPLPEAPKGGEE